jgi:hypothetical protein
METEMTPRNGRPLAKMRPVQGVQGDVQEVVTAAVVVGE